MNTFAADVFEGDVTGPIHCLAHPLTDVEDPFSPYDSFISIIAKDSNLLGNVIIEPTDGDPPVPGRIHSLRFSRGFIGREGPEDPIKPVEIRADYAIELVAAKEIHAFIGGTDIPGSSDAYVERIAELETYTNNGGTGLFTGDILAERLEYRDSYEFEYARMRFEGDMLGRIWLQQFPSGTSYEILMPGTPAFGLKGTISIGVLDHSGGTSLWGGRVLLGLTLNDPDITLDSSAAEGYSLLATELGGGAAGLVPFRLHREDCFPPSTAAEPIYKFLDLAGRPSGDIPIKMRHYGPVNWVKGEGIPPPFKVERRRIGGCIPECWKDQTDCFTLSREANDTVVVLRPDMGVSLQQGYEYKVSLQTDPETEMLVLRSDVPHTDAENDPEVYPYDELVFHVCDVPGDGNADDIDDVDFADITNVLANFGLTDCLLPGDADRDGDRDFSDITSVLTNFGQGPFCEGSQRLIYSPIGDGFTTMDAMEEPTTAASAATAVLDALAQMGYTSIEAFTNAIAQMSEEDRNAEIRRLGQLLSGE